MMVDRRVPLVDLPFWPLFLGQDEAARYLGVSIDVFSAEVAAGEINKLIGVFVPHVPDQVIADVAAFVVRQAKTKGIPTAMFADAVQRAARHQARVQTTFAKDNLADQGTRYAITTGLATAKLKHPHAIGDVAFQIKGNHHWHSLAARSAAAKSASLFDLISADIGATRLQAGIALAGRANHAWRGANAQVCDRRNSFRRDHQCV
jgi:hypothetical protein